MLKLKLQYFDHLMGKTDIGKDPDAGKDWGQEEKGTAEDEMVGWHHWLNGHESEKLRETVKDKEAWHAAVHGFTKSWTWLSHWTTAKWLWVHEWMSPASSSLLRGLLYQFFAAAMSSPEKQNIQNWTLDLSDEISPVQQTFITFTESSVWMKFCFCWLLASIFWERFFSLLATPPFLSVPLCWPPELGDGSAFSGIICVDCPPVNFPGAWGLGDWTPCTCPSAACSEMGQSRLLLSGSKTRPKELSQVPSAVLNKLPSPSDWASSFFFFDEIKSKEPPSPFFCQQLLSSLKLRTLSLEGADFLIVLFPSALAFFLTPDKSTKLVKL